MVCFTFAIIIQYRVLSMKQAKVFCRFEIKIFFYLRFVLLLRFYRKICFFDNLSRENLKL